MTEAALSPIQQLRSLAERPEEQARYAVTLLRPQQPRDVLQAALTVLTRQPQDAARGPLLTLYAYFNETPGKRDAGGYLRRPILDALRPVVTPTERPLLLTAVQTYERYPPTFAEEAGLVRAAGLVTLNEIDEELARFHAVRLLADIYRTDRMSGQPAVSAVDVLAAQGEILPLYLYAMLPLGEAPGEVTAASLRALTSLPDALVETLLLHYAECENAIVLIGLFDLLLGHAAGIQGRAFMADFLPRTTELDLYRYLVTLLVASGDDQLLDLLLAALQWESHAEKRAIACEALLIREGEPRIDEAIARLAR